MSWCVCVSIVSKSWCVSSGICNKNSAGPSLAIVSITLQHSTLCTAGNKNLLLYWQYQWLNEDKREPAKQKWQGQHLERGRGLAQAAKQIVRAYKTAISSITLNLTLLPARTAVPRTLGLLAAQVFYLREEAGWKNFILSVIVSCWKCHHGSNQERQEQDTHVRP